VKAALASRRLPAQRLVGEPLSSPTAVVGHLGALQSQLHDMALWAIGRRCDATLAEVSASFAAGDFIRTHVLRPTWHHVLPADLPDLLEVTAPRIRQAMASNNRRDGLTPESIRAQAALAVEAIHTGGPLTRPEVEQMLTDAGFARQGNSIAHVMIEAELTGQIHSGPMRGKQHTYVAADLPASRRTPDERLAWLAQVYGRGHGPFRVADLAWWTTMTLGQARRAIDLAELEPVEVAGETHYLVESPNEAAVPKALLLPCFDEYTSYVRDPDDFALVDGNAGVVFRSSGLLFLQGVLAGTWNRIIGSSEVRITVSSNVPLGGSIRSAIADEASRFARFVERGLDLEIN
jgi:hypothetical protein